jgi:Domain of unknown function (DUF4345)
MFQLRSLRHYFPLEHERFRASRYEFVSLEITPVVNEANSAAMPTRSSRRSLLGNYRFDRSNGVNMSIISIAKFLKLVAPIFWLVGAAHLIFGLGADAMLGPKVPAEALTEPGLDSQNRFYGVAFTLYGTLLFVCASDLVKYRTIVMCLLWTFFAAGLARIVSIAKFGVPPPLIVALLAIELIAPPIAIYWLSKTTRPSK